MARRGFLPGLQSHGLRRRFEILFLNKYFGGTIATWSRNLNTATSFLALWN